MNILIQRGFQLEKAKPVAKLYEQAFGAKFASAISDRAQRIQLLSACFIPAFSFTAIFEDEVIGLAGFQQSDGSLTAGIDMKQLIEELGLLKGLWACLVFSLFERRPKPGELVMDGIAVDSRFRGQGVGSQLLEQIIAYASDNGFETVRLDVIHSNPRARKLYESKGFVAVKYDYFPYLKWLIGFSGSTTMVLKLTDTT
ncbi:GNAT family N-acetyltransferase [Halomonas llamarensis]|uniref:GNAT family N-acetyltransferase n=1 Tax=Halomonas llamarensis TaxID=2945104 RepID=A0ABT0SQK4_9GAMM|nr:GNAT family N-acetyltransferase [Halomonas llamarensis]MCL7930090.1 GNAT family N-acetyltransferase [Halomonas llamarensis]